MGASRSTSDIPLIETGTVGPPGVSLATVNMAVTYDKAANAEKYEHCIESAAERGAQLIVFPEQSLQGYLWDPKSYWTLPPEQFEHHFALAEPVPGDITRRLTRLAGQLNVHIVIGLTELNDTYAAGLGNLFNSAVLIGPEGVIGVHRKVHTPGGEKHIYAAGDRLDVFATPVGRIGMLICYDACFPEAPRVQAIGGAEIIVMPTAWAAGPELRVQGTETPHYLGYVTDLMQRCRALENQVWFVSSNWVGTDERAGWEYYGHSRIIHPAGVVVAEGGVDESIIVAHGLDIRGEILRARTAYFYGDNFLFDRRPEIYQPVVATNPASGPFRRN
jgi:predicted amidohydrolase